MKILCWLLSQPNVQLILGNHEAMLLSCAFVFEEITNGSIAHITPEKLEFLNTYMRNGGDVTLRALQRLMESSPETMLYILDYLRDAPLYETVSTEKTTFCSFMRGSVILIKTKNCPAIPLTISCGPGRSFRTNISMTLLQFSNIHPPCHTERNIREKSSKHERGSLLMPMLLTGKSLHFYGWMI